MISVQEALQILQDNIPPARRAIVPLEAAYGNFLYEDQIAPEPSPRYTNSAMDGFAVRWADCAHATREHPVALELIGESQAGIPFDGLVRGGLAVRISTGAVLPDGADTVIRQEDTRETGDRVEILAIQALGQDVRRQGEEFHAGDLLLARGTRLAARELALLAAFGICLVPVHVQPQVALLVTGTELARPDDQQIKPHQIRDSNSIMLASAVRDAGAILRSIVRVSDSPEETIVAIEQAVAADVDVILCSGGVSVGQHDHVKEGALTAGFTELFWKISQKPGKPLLACRQGNTLLFGLPGNPVSAFMCFSNYVRPVLATLQGTSSVSRTLTARSPERVANTGKRTNFIRVTVEEHPNELAVIREMARQGSHMLSSIVHADGYIVLEPGEVLEANGLIEVVLF
ncbi:gephyrin-like molybdotransferase Glp [Desulfofustis glycolicus]|uniref:Molybdopterin molybdenumtransferase n=1 Tax=Desulfofustis glycolicus DSM 9705 TaxID=1121409 RepID=A0A1M5V0U4_9BACT|nr:gephyrin-like molybdotransferase Glp [Desulfofustis glycolicus]SHH68780.1 molybdopterin molybdotransferase [Desulfofustis glycolicus DSM 9705]